MRQLDTAVLTQRAYLRLREQIATGELEPGQRLDVRRLCEVFGTSLTPIKEALVRLAAEGLIVISPRRGTFVVEFGARETAERLATRLALELYAVEQGLPRLAGVRLRRMNDLARRMEQCVASGGTGLSDATWWDRVRLDQRFHALLVEAAGNCFLAETHERLQTHLLVALAQRRGVDYARVDSDHRAILDALAGGSLPGVRAALARHVANAQAAVERAVSDRTGTGSPPAPG